MFVVAICTLLCGAAMALPAPERYTVEHAFGLSGSFRQRCKLQSEIDSGDRLTFKNTTLDGAGKLSVDDIALLLEAVSADDVYRLRIALDTPNPSYVYASTKACVLVAAGLVHNVRLMLADDGSLRAADIQLSLHKKFGGCRGVQGLLPSQLAGLNRVMKGEDAKTEVQLTSRFVPIVTEEAVPIPPLSVAKGIPYPGQKEFTEAEVQSIMGTTGAGAGGAATGNTAEAEAALQAKQAESSKTFLERNWHFIAIAVIWLLMKNQGGEESSESGSGASGGGARAPGGAARVAAGGKNERGTAGAK